MNTKQIDKLKTILTKETTRLGDLHYNREVKELKSIFLNTKDYDKLAIINEELEDFTNAGFGIVTL
ncbi:MAG: hypothetical protein IPN86_20870 [Saprospiraceae bacterium]|nr:hypothetical protein [Saprospiraceae bacterium]